MDVKVEAEVSRTSAAVNEAQLSVVVELRCTMVLVVAVMDMETRLERRSNLSHKLRYL